MLDVATRVLAVWTGILALAVANGALREAVLIPQLGRTPGLVLSGALLSTLILLVAYLSLPWLGVRRPAQTLGVGLAWLLLTLAFEFSFGLLRGKPLSEILQAYTFSDGNLWPIVLVVTALAPYAAARFRGWL